ncbi:SsrA-binding protein, partial [Streptococcus hyovaginalis]
MIVETLEAGICLTGTEIKAVRAARIQLTNGFAQSKKGEAWVVKGKMATFEQGNTGNQDPERQTKQWNKKEETKPLAKEVKRKGVKPGPVKGFPKKHRRKG